MAGAGSAHGAKAPTDTQPQPIPGGIDIPPLIHVWAPGPKNIILPFSGGQLMGGNVDPSTITDRHGFSAVAYPAGTATGSDGVTYNLEADFRVFQGHYVSAGGQVLYGTFALI